MAKQSRGVQGFLEHRAEGPAFALAVLCMVARASQFYSGGALLLARVLGPAGMAVFNIGSGIGLAVGCELLGSIAGRAWQLNKMEALEVRGRKGLARAERQALAEHFASRARLSFLFMCIGLGASVCAAFAFMWTESGSHSLSGILGELVVTLLLVSVIAYLGIFKESSQSESASEIASAQAVSLRASIVDAAGKRIATGKHTPQDVRLVARALPRAERERFEAALLPETANDPHWTVRDIASWLGCDTPAGRRQIVRKLSRLAEHGTGVLRDDTGAYRVPRSVVIATFAEDFLAINGRGSARNTPTLAGTPGTSGTGGAMASAGAVTARTEPGQTSHITPLHTEQDSAERSTGHDTDRTGTRASAGARPADVLAHALSGAHPALVRALPVLRRSAEHAAPITRSA